MYIEQMARIELITLSIIYESSLSYSEIWICMRARMDRIGFWRSQNMVKGLFNVGVPINEQNSHMVGAKIT